MNMSQYFVVYRFGQESNKKEKTRERVSPASLTRVAGDGCSLDAPLEDQTEEFGFVGPDIGISADVLDCLCFGWPNTADVIRLTDVSDGVEMSLTRLMFCKNCRRLTSRTSGGLRCDGCGNVSVGAA